MSKSAEALEMSAVAITAFTEVLNIYGVPSESIASLWATAYNCGNAVALAQHIEDLQALREVN